MVTSIWLRSGFFLSPSSSTFRSRGRWPPIALFRLIDTTRTTGRIGRSICKRQATAIARRLSIRAARGRLSCELPKSGDTVPPSLEYEMIARMLKGFHEPGPFLME